jgi:hypothetical protein
MHRFLSVAVLLLAAFGARAIIIAGSEARPTAAICYAFDGSTVETTYLDGGLHYYPAPVSSSVNPVPDSPDFIIGTTTRFIYTGRHVYLPAISR